MCLPAGEPQEEFASWDAADQGTAEWRDEGAMEAQGAAVAGDEGVQGSAEAGDAGVQESAGAGYERVQESAGTGDGGVHGATGAGDAGVHGAVRAGDTGVQRAGVQGQVTQELTLQRGVGVSAHKHGTNLQ